MAGEITRFAPSPTGLLHLGHAAAALFAATCAGRDGRFLVRIEDIDPVRCRPEYSQALLEDLAWLELLPDQAPRYQSQHMDTYRQALDRLEALGVLYPCFCSRSDILRESGDILRAPHGPDGVLYPGTCRHLDSAQREDRIAAGQPFALRLDMAAACRLASEMAINPASAADSRPGHWLDRDHGWQPARPQQFGDVVLARKDTPASYHLAVTVDDALQGITLVTRGEDLREATHLHRLLQSLLGLPVPHYRFHRLLCGADGRRLAKRDRAETLRSLRERGLSAADVRQMASLDPRDRNPGTGTLKYYP